ncbi:hypothetical protein [Celeribacter halophilus]|nr:hypothetical protein [Celeribacter halophilus]
MLDENAHITIPEVDVPAFFKAELRTYLEDLRNARMMERMDGTLTATREQHNRVEAFVLRSLVEDGLRENMSEKRLMELPINQRAPAARVQNEKFKEFMSPEFNQAVLERAASKDRIQHMSQHEKLRLRWAAVEARMAAHHAVETVPLHAGESACIAAETMLRALVAPSTAAPHPRNDILSSQSQTFASAGMGTAVDTSSASDAGSLVSFSDDKTPFLTPGVSLISKRITANRIKTQRNEALAQPEARVFNGNAMDAEIERRFGQDLFGTAVRMTRSKECTQGTKDQALKTVTLFIYVTGIQLVTDIRAHHLEIFSNAIAKEMPKTYWKSPRQRDLTFKEILEEARTLPAAKVGLSPATIERHLVTLKSIIEHAEYEGNHLSPLLHEGLFLLASFRFCNRIMIDEVPGQARMTVNTFTQMRVVAYVVRQSLSDHDAA